jgi:hypothetical protein
MVSRGYEAPIAGKPNWITGQPNWWLAVAWAAILVGATLLAAVRLLSHLALYALATVVAWRVLVAMRRETHAER